MFRSSLFQLSPIFVSVVRNKFSREVYECNIGRYMYRVINEFSCVILRYKLIIPNTQKGRKLQ